jgi:homoserine dehydrogenase
MRNRPLIVLKFGSSVLRSEADLPAAVHEIYRWIRNGHRVIAVVSAIGNSTEKLLAKAHTFGAAANDPAVATLLATGEATSTALLSLVLDRAGIPAVILDEVRLGLRTQGPVLNSEPAGSIHRPWSKPWIKFRSWSCPVLLAARTTAQFLCLAVAALI